MHRFLRSAPVKRLSRLLPRRLRRSVRVARGKVGVLRANSHGGRHVDDVNQRDDVRSELAALRTEHALSSRRLTELSTGVAEVRRAVDELGTSTQGDGDAVRTELEHRVRHLTSLVETFRCSLMLLLGPTGRHFTRFVSEDEVDRLVTELEMFGPRDRSVAAVHQAYRTLVELEMRCVGRAAGSTTTTLATLAAVALVAPPSSDVLVVRAGHGITASGISRQLARRGIDARLTLVDRFSAHTHEPDRAQGSDASLTPLTPGVVTRNLELGGVPVEHCRLIDGEPEAADVRATVADRRYGLVVADAGTQAADAAVEELEWIATIVLPSASVILVDWLDPTRLAAGAALDHFGARAATGLHLVGRAATCAFFCAT